MHTRPGDASAHFALGRVYRMQRLAEKAIRCFRQVLTLDPKHTEAARALADALAEVGRFDEAVAAARNALLLARETGSSDLTAQIEERLKLYEKQQPPP